MRAPQVLADTQVWWFVARSSGIVAWALSALAVLWGMALSSRALGRRPPAAWLLDVHRFLGGLTVAFLAVHLVALVLDPFVAFGPVDILVPFASSWEPLAVAWGVVALYLLVAVELTSLLRARLPLRLWRAVHLSSYALYAFATVHLLTAGSEHRNPALLGCVVVSGAPSSSSPSTAGSALAEPRVFGPADRHVPFHLGPVPLGQPALPAR